jgi:hypothetical protein
LVNSIACIRVHLWFQRLYRREDGFEAYAGVVEDFAGFAAGFGEVGDVEALKLDFVAAGCDGGGDFGV